MLEPLLVGFIGLIVGGMVISLYLPLFKLGEIA
jgi:type IV pilus assembly protein PilC